MSELKKKWYVVQAYSGYEKKVKQQIEERVDLAGLTEFVDRVLVPSEDVVDMKEGKKRHYERKLFPGYVLVEMVAEDSVVQLIRRMPRVSGFVGGTTGHPIAISSIEADRILGVTKGGEFAQSRQRHDYQIGEVIRICDGPFQDCNASIEEVNAEKGLLKVMVSIFGRDTPVDLSFSEVEKS